MKEDALGQTRAQGARTHTWVKRKGEEGVHAGAVAAKGDAGKGRYVLPGSFGSLDFLLFRAQRHAPLYLLNKIHTLED